MPITPSNLTKIRRLEDAIAKIADGLSSRVKIGKSPDEFEASNMKQVTNVKFIEKVIDAPDNRGRMPSFRQNVTYRFQLEYIINDARTHQSGYGFLESLELAFYGNDFAKQIDPALGLSWVEKVAFREKVEDVCWVWEVDLAFSGVEANCLC